MRWITFRRRDHGATTLIVAIVVPVVLLLVGALVVSVGEWYSNRAATQNGSDSAAIAVAKTCASITGCNPGVASAYAASNQAAAAQIDARTPCGNDAGHVLPACSTTTVQNGTTCPINHPTYYVDVITITKASQGVGGSLASKQKQIAACTQAAWGPPTSLGGAVAVTISACEWLKNTNNGASFATIPPGGYRASAPYYTAPPSYLATINTRRNDPVYGSGANNYYVSNNIKDPHKPVLNAPIAGSETVITTQGFGNNCNGGTPGWAAPGQFGWLSSSSCLVPISGPTYTGSTGVGNEPPCYMVFNNSLQTKTPIYLPVYTTVTGTGSNATFTLDGFAAFVVTGWDIKGGQSKWGGPPLQPSVVEQADQSPANVLSPNKIATDAAYCGTFTASPADECIYGYFTKALIPPSDLPGGGGSGVPLGASSVYLTG